MRLGCGTRLLLIGKYSAGLMVLNANNMIVREVRRYIETV